MSLFSNIYNTVAKFFRPQEEQAGDASKSVATNRLKLVLMQDRTNLTPRILEQMRGELIELLSRYVELDKELLDLNFEQEGNQVALMLSIPVIRAKDEEEIEAAIREHNEAMGLNKSEENVSDNSNESSEQEETIIENNSEKEEKSERTEEEQAEADKADAIANELKDVPKIIKKKEKKEVSAPEEMSNNPFKSNSGEYVDVLETTQQEK